MRVRAGVQRKDATQRAKDWRLETCSATNLFQAGGTAKPVTASVPTDLVALLRSVDTLDYLMVAGLSAREWSLARVGSKLPIVILIRANRWEVLSHVTE